MTVAPKELLPPVKPSGNEPEKKSRITRHSDGAQKRGI